MYAHLIRDISIGYEHTILSLPTSIGNGGDCRRRKKLLIERRPVRNRTRRVQYQACFVQKITFVLRKINKNCCHQSCRFLLPICTKSFVGWGFVPDPMGELTALPQTS